MGVLDWLKKKQTTGNPQLETMMRDLAAENSDKARERFFRALLAGRLIVPSPGLAASDLPLNQSGQTDRDVSINIIGMEAPDGSRAMIAFTSEASILAWRPVGCPYVDLPAGDVFAMAVRSGLESVVLNPAGPSGGFVTRHELLALAEGTLPAPDGLRQIGNATRMALSAPARPASPVLTAAVCAAVQRRPEVVSAWILELVVGGGEPHLCVVIEHLPGRDPDAFVPAIMSDIQPTLAKDDYLDCLPQPTGSAMIGSARTAAAPVFTRNMTS